MAGTAVRRATDLAGRPGELRSKRNGLGPHDRAGSARLAGAPGRAAPGCPVAETVVYLRGPGTVVRWRNCSGMLMVISQIRGMNCADLGGLTALDPGQGG